VWPRANAPTFHANGVEMNQRHESDAVIGDARALGLRVRVA